jgi:hypothetical protein
MFKYGLGVMAVVMIGGIIAGPVGGVGIAQENLQPITVRGNIWDSTCAAANSHGNMMTKTQAKSAKECTLNCIQSGAQLVLLNPDDKTIYHLDSQDKVKEYAGQLVTVIGSYDRSTGILHVDRVESAM